MSPDTNTAQSEQARTKGDMKQHLNLELINRLEIPLTLNPENCTLEDIKIHGLCEQYLSESTMDHHIAYLRFMETHTIPVDIRHPTIENFKRHVRYRLYIEKAGVSAIHHEYKALKMVLQAYGQPAWNIKLPPMPKHKRRQIPLPENAREFWHYKYSKKRYERKLYQYMLFHSFMIGMRSPSELANLRTTDVNILRNHKAILTITETKKHSSIREIALPEYLATDPYHKSMQNWLTSWRPQVENSKSDDYLYLQPSGKPFGRRFLGKKLAEQGRKVWRNFKPYATRHWCAIARLIETKIQTGNYRPYTIRNWLGHDTIKTTEGYIQYAEQYYDLAPYSWIQCALKCKKKDAEESTLKTSKPPKNDPTRFSNRRNRGWARRISHWLTGEKKRRDINKNFSLVFSYFQLLTKPFRSFFLFIQHGRSCFESELRCLLGCNYCLSFFASFDHKTFHPPLQWRCN